ncbi:hypothetical protein DPMN_115169 [Dreissena polymorpha]|uniref:Uncharacterized protein n=1 Tax=Dreissena polymorpha TaxID=45954 RepID=A0A9D4QS83_DREPO|nr:hypothetical protein DPMN_115169 [Dreissena polymorpha]
MDRTFQPGQSIAATCNQQGAHTDCQGPTRQIHISHTNMSSTHTILDIHNNGTDKN